MRFSSTPINYSKNNAFYPVTLHVVRTVTCQERPRVIHAINSAQMWGHVLRSVHTREVDTRTFTINKYKQK